MFCEIQRYNKKKKKKVVMKMMGLSSEYRVLALFAFVIISLSVAAESGDNNGGSVGDYITWDDLTVDENGLASKSNSDVQVIVVDQNGNGHSSTVQGAVDMVPDHNSQRAKIYISPGTYREKVFIPKNKPYVSFIGKRNQTHGVVITWNSKSSDIGSNGQELGTYGSATVAVESDYFCANRITFENSVVAEAGGQGMQGVALRVDSDRAMFYQVRFLGTQDTLLDNTGTHYFLKCFIQGKIDFICGSARSLYEGCRLRSTAENYGAIAAHHRDTPKEETGFSFVGCSIQGTGKVYLGRAWGDYSRIIYSNCYMEDVIIPQGWTEWNRPSRKKTAVFGEFQCQGKGAVRNHRVPWAKSFTYEEARPFLDRSFINGDQWLRL